MTPPSPSPDGVAAARRYARLRTSIALVVGLGFLAISWLGRDTLAYAITSEEAQPLGDLRRLAAPGQAVAENLSHNTFVRFDEALMTAERRGSGATGARSYFYDPAVNLIVVTERPLPSKPDAPAPLSPAAVRLIVGNWALPLDFTASFSGEGRLLDAARAPQALRDVVETYRTHLDLDGRRPGEPLWVFIDGESPDKARSALWLFGGGLVLVLLSAIQAFRARRAAIDAALDSAFERAASLALGG